MRRQQPSERQVLADVVGVAVVEVGAAARPARRFANARRGLLADAGAAEAPASEAGRASPPARAATPSGRRRGVGRRGPFALVGLLGAVVRRLGLLRLVIPPSAQSRWSPIGTQAVERGRLRGAPPDWPASTCSRDQPVGLLGQLHLRHVAALGQDHLAGVGSASATCRGEVRRDELVVVAPDEQRRRLERRRAGSRSPSRRRARRGRCCARRRRRRPARSASGRCGRTRRRRCRRPRGRGARAGRTCSRTAPRTVAARSGCGIAASSGRSSFTSGTSSRRRSRRAPARAG